MDREKLITEIMKTCIDYLEDAHISYVDDKATRTALNKLLDQYDQEIVNGIKRMVDIAVKH